MECTEIGIRSMAKGMFIASLIFIIAGAITFIMKIQGVSLFCFILAGIFLCVGIAAYKRPDLFPFIFE